MKDYYKLINKVAKKFVETNPEFVVQKVSIEGHFIPRDEGVLNMSVEIESSFKEDADVLPAHRSRFHLPWKINDDGEVEVPDVEDLDFTLSTEGKKFRLG